MTIKQHPVEFPPPMFGGLTAKIQDHINAMPVGVRTFEAPDLARKFDADEDDVRKIIGGNGLTVERDK